MMSKHRWSGWPGAWCLDCGKEDSGELCAIEHDFETCTLPECAPSECSKPNSHEYDPYYNWPDGTYHPLIKNKDKLPDFGQQVSTRTAPPPVWTGDPTCWICGHEYEPYTGDGDGACYFCYNGVKRET